MSWTPPKNKTYEEHLADVQGSFDWDSIKSEYNESPSYENRRGGLMNQLDFRSNTLGSDYKLEQFGEGFQHARAGFDKPPLPEAAPAAAAEAAPEAITEAGSEAGSDWDSFFKDAGKTGVGVGAGQLAADAIIGTIKTLGDAAKSPQGSIAPFLPGGGSMQGQDYAGMALSQGILAALNKAGSIATRFGG